MAYAIQADLGRYIDSSTLIQLTDDNADGAVDAAVVTDVLDGATSRIDAAMAGRYAVPCAAPGEALGDLCVRLAIAPLYARRPMVEAPAAVELLTRSAEADLKALRSGSMVPPEAVPLGAGQAVGGVSVVSDDDQGWTEDLY